MCFWARTRWLYFTIMSFLTLMTSVGTGYDFCKVRLKLTGYGSNATLPARAVGVSWAVGYENAYLLCV